MLQIIKPEYVVSRPKIARDGSSTQILRFTFQITWSVTHKQRISEFPTRYDSDALAYYYYTRQRWCGMH
jgi:hypothetical protein